MSINPQLKQRMADAQSRRRRKLEPSRRKEFDQFYGKPGSSSAARNVGGAGKGDASRVDNRLAFDIGYELSYNKDLTEDEREELTAAWGEAKQRR